MLGPRDGGPTAVKEQLKNRGLFEFYRTSFSYIDRETSREVTVAVPEQGGRGAISQDPLPPGEASGIGRSTSIGEPLQETLQVLPRRHKLSHTPEQ